MLNINGSIITIDAIGCQKSIATLSRQQGADYVLALKGNQGNLYTQVEQLFQQAQAGEFSGIEHRCYDNRLFSFLNVVSKFEHYAEEHLGLEPRKLERITRIYFIIHIQRFGY